MSSIAFSKYIEIENFYFQRFIPNPDKSEFILHYYLRIQFSRPAIVSTFNFCSRTLSADLTQIWWCKIFNKNRWQKARRLKFKIDYLCGGSSIDKGTKFFE